MAAVWRVKKEIRVRGCTRGVMRTSNTAVLFPSLRVLMLFSAVLTFGQITPSDDAYTLTTTPKRNYGGSGSLQLESGKATVFLRFDLSSIPSTYTSSNIAKATLKLYANSVTKPGNFNVNYVLGSWSEKTITAQKAPAIGTTIASGLTVTAGSKDSYISVDVTTALCAWLDRSQDNDGIALVANHPLKMDFASKEYDSASHSPELGIVFSRSSRKRHPDARAE